MSAGVSAPTGASDRFASVFSQVVSERFAAIPVNACLVWDLQNTPDAALAHIAEGLGLSRVLGVEPLRHALPDGFALIGRRGMASGVRTALEAMGYEVTFIGGLGVILCDGTINASGEPNRCGSDSPWYVCQVRITAGAAVSAAQVKELWDAIDYFGRRSTRYILTITDPSGEQVYRDNSTVPEDT